MGVPCFRVPPSFWFSFNTKQPVVASEKTPMVFGYLPGVLKGTRCLRISKAHPPRQARGLSLQSRPVYAACFPWVAYVDEIDGQQLIAKLRHVSGNLPRFFGPGQA